MEKIVITGGLGYLGLEVCKAYSGEARYKNITIIGGKFIGGNVKLITDWGMKFVQASILDEGIMERELSDADIIIHLAGMTEVSHTLSDSTKEEEDKINKVNVEGTRNVIKYSNPNSKIIFISSHVVYEGLTEVKKNIEEDEAPQPILPYAKSKVQSEIDFSESNRNFVILRLGSVYGYSTGTMRTSIMPNLFSKITAQNETINLFSGGVQLKSMVSLIDVVRCITFMVENDDINKEIFHLSNEGMTVKEVAEICKEIKPSLNIVETEDEIINLGYTLSNEKLLKTGFSFIYDIKTCIKEMINNWSYKEKPKDLEYTIVGDKEYIDERGKISNYELPEPINLIGYIESKAGTVRANHYHPIQEQKCLLIKGKYISVIKDLADPNAVIETKLIVEGDISVIQPNVAHTTVFLEDSILLNLVRGEREHENYGITHTIYHEIVDEEFRQQLLEGYKATCRSCGSNRLDNVISLGKLPLANNLLNDKDEEFETFPLELNYCSKCYNVQLSYSVPSNKMFDKYLYVSSTTQANRKHFEDAADVYIEKYNLNEESLVVDIGSNDGIGLKRFVDKGIKVLGIEPASNVAKIANNKGINTISKYFDDEMVELFHSDYQQADLVLASNVFAHVDDLMGIANNAFEILKNDGVFIVEVQYLYNMIKDLTFDNIYHEHVNYWSVTSIKNFFDKLNLCVVDVDHLETHGGSIRVYIKTDGLPNQNVINMLNMEYEFGLLESKTYKNFRNRILETKKNVLKNIEKLKDGGYTLVGYGSPAKATTTLNYYGLTNEDIKFIVEDNELKHHKFVPNTGIPVLPKSELSNSDDKIKVIIFAWNFADEIIKNNSNLIDEGIEFISIKELTINV